MEVSAIIVDNFIKWSNPDIFLIILYLFLIKFRYNLKSHRCCASGLNHGAAGFVDANVSTEL